MAAYLNIVASGISQYWAQLHNQLLELQIMDKEKKKESWLSEAPNWLLAVVFVVLLLLFIATNYWKLFSSSNWGEQYFEGKSIFTLLGDLKAHIEPLILFAVSIIVGLVVYWLNGKKS